MRSVFTIAWRDIRALFVSPTAYVVITGFLLLAGWFFFNLLGQFNRLIALYSGVQGADMAWLNLNDAVIAPLYQQLAFVLLIVVPIITMRSFAEERATGTYELLFTSPITIGQIVVGKFLASLFMVTLLIACAAIYPLIVIYYGNPELGLTWTGLLGLYLTAVAYVAVGNFASAVTSNQIIAATVSLVTLLLLFVVNWAAEGAGQTLKALLTYASIPEHFTVFVRGVIDTKDLVYFLSLTGAFLFLTYRAVESARWR